jgi:hypothetical protein
MPEENVPIPLCLETTLGCAMKGHEIGASALAGGGGVPTDDPRLFGVTGHLRQDPCVTAYDAAGPHLFDRGIRRHVIARRMRGRPLTLVPCLPALVE